MFDDQPGASGTPVPNNLPLGEPQDIFESTDNASSLPPLPGEAAPVAPLQSSDGQSSALSAGILKPKTQDLPPLNINRPSVPPSTVGLPPQENIPPQGSAPAENAIKEPTLSRGIMITIMAVVVGFVLIGSGWFVYRIFTKDTAEPVVIEQRTDTDLPPEEDSETPAPVVTPPLEDITATTSSDAVDQEIITGESTDSDGDGLKDNREAELGTDPANWDTDTDDLSDGEELLIWHTNPKNSDTDGDTYKDGQEVKAGYSPTGPGRLAEIAPTTSGSTSTAPTPTPTSQSTTTPAPEPAPTTTTAETSTDDSSMYEIEL